MLKLQCFINQQKQVLQLVKAEQHHYIPLARPTCLLKQVELTMVMKLFFCSFEQTDIIQVNKITF